MASYETDLCRLQLLGLLELSKRSYAKAFLHEIHQYIDSVSNSFIWCDHRGMPSQLLDESATYILTQKIAKHLLHNEIELINFYYENKASFHSKIFDTQSENFSVYRLKRHYQKIFFAVGYHKSLFCPVVVEENLLGYLVINRTHHQPNFTDEEKHSLSIITEILSAGMSKPEVKDYYNFTPVTNSGLVIINLRADVMQCCPTGINLLTLALQNKSNQFLNKKPENLANVPNIFQIIANTLSKDPVRTSNFILESAWGQFAFYAHPLVDEEGQRETHVCLNINWLTPIPLKMYQNIGVLNLTPRQQIISLLYAAGDPTKLIAQKLKLSLYTVKEHIQNIFERLDIHTRADLMQRIICDENITT